MSTDSPEEHPDSLFTPELAWGDPVPLLWQRTAPGRWRAWPPRQFRTPGKTGTTLWSVGGSPAGNSFYRPEAEPELAPRGTRHDVGYGWDAPVIEWGAALPCTWMRFDDGRSTVQLATMRVSLPVGEVHFELARHAPDPFFYPIFAHGVRLGEGLVGDAEFMGPPRGLLIMPVSEEKAWRRRTADRRWVLGTLAIEPSGTWFADEPDLLPLTLLAPEEIAAEEARRLSDEQRARSDILYLRLVEDLARSEELMADIGDDIFCAQVQRFMADNLLIRRASDSEVLFTSERNYGWILAHLRRYGESYMMYNANWAEPDPAVQERIRRLFREAGYDSVPDGPDGSAERTGPI